MISVPRHQRTPSALFGRRQPFTFDVPNRSGASSIGDDLRLFATTFAGGLLFMTIYLA